ncbi:MAG: BCCT family transporter, partial [Clostridiales bacterium]
LGSLSLALVLIGTLGAVQSTSIVGAVPLFFVWIIMMIALMRWLKATYGTGVIDVNHPIETKNSTSDAA